MRNRLRRDLLFVYALLVCFAWWIVAEVLGVLETATIRTAGLYRRFERHHAALLERL